MQSAGEEIRVLAYKSGARPRRRCRGAPQHHEACSVVERHCVFSNRGENAAQRVRIGYTFEEWHWHWQVGLKAQEHKGPWEIFENCVKERRLCVMPPLYNATICVVVDVYARFVS